MNKNNISDILSDLRLGKMIILVDDEQRENEGDLVCAAQFVTPQTITFMLRQASGMLCVPLSGELCDKLQLLPQSQVNTAQRSTAYTVSVDGLESYGITTGVSAADRAKTIQLLADPTKTANDFAKPGHIQPLRARKGGVLVRSGQTEGSIDLCKLAGLEPAAVIIEIMNDDGTMARRPELEKLCDTHDLKMCSVADIVSHRLHRDQLVKRVGQQPIQTPFGEFELIAYRSEVDSLLQVALVYGDIGKQNDQGQVQEQTGPVLVRMHSQNLLGDVFEDVTQPTGQTLRTAMQMIVKQGSGILVYLRHDQMGTGLLQQIQTIQHRKKNKNDDDAPNLHTHPTAPAPSASGSPGSPGAHPHSDKAAYGIGAQILRDLGVKHLRLITNHPFTPTALSGFGLDISAFVPVDQV